MILQGWMGRGSEERNDISVNRSIIYHKERKFSESFNGGIFYFHLLLPITVYISFTGCIFYHILPLNCKLKL